MREFDAERLCGSATVNEPLLGSTDIQPLADLGNSFGVVRTMSSTSTTKALNLKVVVATLTPIVPLTLTMIPAAELLKKLFGILLLR